MPSVNMTEYVTAKTVERFWKKVSKQESCWLWIGATSNGRGMMAVTGPSKGAPRRSLNAARMAHFIATGEDPADLVIQRSCDDKLCVNPEHLSILEWREVSPWDPTADNPISINARKTHCERGGHELTGDNLVAYDLKRGVRRCKACAKMSQMEYDDRKRAKSDT